jgi:hypothetical protein
MSGALSVKPNFNFYRACLNKYVRSSNSKPNSEAKAGPHKQGTPAMAAIMLMLEPNHPKATSEHIGEDLRLKHVEQYKKITSNLEVISLKTCVFQNKFLQQIYGILDH